MGAWDLITRTIHSEDWADGAEVVIKEMSYGETTDITKACTRKDGELDDQKVADTTLLASIVSWTFKKDGKVPKVDLVNIKALPVSYITFIAKEIGGDEVDIDDDFPGSTGDGA